MSISSFSQSIILLSRLCFLRTCAANEPEKFWRLDQNPTGILYGRTLS